VQYFGGNVQAGMSEDGYRQACVFAEKKQKTIVATISPCLTTR